MTKISYGWQVRKLPYVAVTGRKRRLFLSLFYHFFLVHTIVTQSVSFPESSNLISSNSYVSDRGLSSFGLYSQSIPLGELIELS